MRNKKIELILLSIIIVSLLSLTVFSVPNSLTLQGKLTNTAGASQQGTFNFTFAVYDNTTSGNKLWESVNQSVATDANGVYDVILSGLNLSFADKYYLGIAVQGENESTPRINLTSSPYSFRANTSEGLNPNASYFVTNLSVSGLATIGNGTSTIDVSTQNFNFSSRSGNLEINGTVTAKAFVGDGSGLSNLSVGTTSAFNSSSTSVFFNDTNLNLGLGLNNPSDRLVVIGNVRISGSLNASSINVTGISLLATNGGFVGIGTTAPTNKLSVIGTINATLVNATAFHTANGTIATPSITFFQDTDTGIAKTSEDNLTLVTGGSARMTVDSSGNVGIGTTGPQNNLEIIGAVTVSNGLNASSINTTGPAYFAVNSGNVGISTTSPNKKLEVNITAASDGISTNGTIFTPIINTTDSGKNITISSGGGSVIIRLG